MAWVVGVSLFVGGLAACTQSEGETCQVNEDCSSGLVCCRTVSAARGSCYTQTDTRCGAASTPPVTDASTDDSDANMSTSDR
jgi:hypothetical protein